MSRLRRELAVLDAMSVSLRGKKADIKTPPREAHEDCVRDESGRCIERGGSHVDLPHVNVLKGVPGEGWAVAVAGDIVAVKIASQIAAQQMALRECKRVGRDPDDYTIEGVPQAAWIAPSAAYGYGERGEKIRANVERLRRGQVVHLKWYDAATDSWRTFCGAPYRELTSTAHGRKVTCKACEARPKPVGLR